MERFKVDEYEVRLKGRTYSVLVFPFVKYMWAFDDRPEEECYMIDGCVEAFSLLKYAMAILVEASDKIVYFPCKQEGIGCYYRDNYNAIICTPKAQLRRSSWIEIRRRLNNSTKKGTYCLQYNRKKLDDYCRERLLEKRYNGVCERYFIRTEISKRMRQEYIEEVLGENLFFVLSKNECYCNHYWIAEDLDEYNAGERYGEWTAMGWIVTPKGIKHMIEDTKKGGEQIV